MIIIDARGDTSRILSKSASKSGNSICTSGTLLGVDLIIPLLCSGKTVKADTCVWILTEEMVKSTKVTHEEAEGRIMIVVSGGAKVLMFESSDDSTELVRFPAYCVAVYNPDGQ